MATEEDKGVTSRAEEFLQLFKKGAEFTQDLLKENERLRFRLLQLEENSHSRSDDVVVTEANRKLADRVSELEIEKKEILERIAQVERENQDFAERYVEIESENNNLANLYIASYQLHSTLDFCEVLQIITEIIINLIGAEEFAILLLDEKTNELNAVATEGVTREEIPSVKLGGRGHRLGRQDRRELLRGRCHRVPTRFSVPDGLYSPEDKGTRHRRDSDL